MKRILIVIGALMVFSLATKASHIVGGEFELLHLPNGLDGIEKYRYQLNLIYYFDVLNNKFSGPPESLEPTLRVIIFRKSDNAPMETITLSYLSKDRVSYTQPDCSKANIVVTDKLIYTNSITLSPTTYNDPEGYYVAWERCCRNYQLVNIFSNDPAAPGAIPAGQTFYLEFPPVVKNGLPFINSSPQSFPPLRDYACPARTYYADFAGIDADGDVLVYTKVDPLSTHSAEALPDILPAPYPTVTWFPPFGIDNIMGGHPDFKISPEGFITVTPGRIAGLYAFAVKCEEYRDGVKIGETRRDFQLNVSSSCPDADPPQIVGRKKGDTNFSNVNQPLHVEFLNSINNSDRCIEVSVSDPDALKPTENFQENIVIKAIPINFKDDIQGILPSITSATLTKDDPTKVFTICFDECPFIDGPFQIGILAFDDACALPLGDTLYVTVDIELPPNNKPKFTTPNVTETLFEDQSQTWPIHGIDTDGDPLTVNVITDGFELNDFGFDLNIAQNSNGIYDAELTWDTHCIGYNFSARDKFDIKIIIDNQDMCGFFHLDTMEFKLNIISVQPDPIIDSDLTPDPEERIVHVTKMVFESLDFNVTGTEANNEFINLVGNGIGFTLQDYNMTFSSASGNGNVSSPFDWNILCNSVNLVERDSFDVQFILSDNQSSCHIYRADTLDVIVKVEPPVNGPPTLLVYNHTTNALVTDTLSYFLGEQITLDIIGTDTDINPFDILQIDLVEASGNVEPVGYVFTPASAISPAKATFTWTPDCSIFKDDHFQNKYNFKFRVVDDRCHIILVDSFQVFINVHDVLSDNKKFLPPNVITPNGDGCNDYFAMEGIEIDNEHCPPVGGNPDDHISLPKDNCIRHFEGIRIYNRWGKEIFSSTQRNFRWYPQDISVGVYFYYVTYTDKTFKGTVSVRL